MLEEMSAFPMTKQNQVYLELASLLIQWKCPMYAFDSLLDWMRRSCQAGNFNTGASHPLYATFMKHLRTSVNANQCIPVVIPMEYGPSPVGEDGHVEHELPRRTVTAIQYEFIQEVRNLFAEPFAYNPENMVINRNPDDWFLPYSPDDQGEGSIADVLKYEEILKVN